MEICNMAKDIVQEAVEQAEAMKEAAYENAKSVLVDAMSTNLKAAVSEAIGEKIEETGNPKGAALNVNYDPEGIEELEGDDLSDEGDGPAIVEAGLEEEEVVEGEYGGNKGDESRSRRDYEATLEDEDEEDEEIDVDVDIDTDDDDDDDEDIDEVLEFIEDEDEDYGGNKGDESRSHRDYEAALEDEDEDVDVDVDDDIDENQDVEERGMLNKKIESAVKENRQLRRENRRYEKALTFLKKRIDEVNLFNARLAAASDLMRKVSLTKGEKERVVEHFDKARTVGEVKRTHRALAEGYSASNRGVKKQRVARPNVQSVISEEQKSQNDGQFNRMAELAGL